MRTARAFTIPQVGDCLSDKDSCTFAAAMAKKLEENSWVDSKDREAAQTVFLSMNSNARTLIVRQLRLNLGGEHHLFQHQALSHVIRTWPLAMQLVRFSSTPLTANALHGQQALKRMLPV